MVLRCRLPGSTFLLAEPITLTAELTGVGPPHRDEPLFFEGGTVSLSVLDERGRAPRSEGEIVDTLIPRMQGLPSRSFGTLVFERELVAGSLLASGATTRTLQLETRRSVAGGGLLSGEPVLGPGAYTLRLRQRLLGPDTRQQAGLEFLEADVQFELATVPEHEKAAFQLITSRPAGSEDSMAQALAAFRALYQAHPRSRYAPWARYFAAKLLVHLGRWEEARHELDQIGGSAGAEALPRYQVAYLRALTLAELGERAQARRALKEAIPRDTLVLLDTTETGRQEEGWRLVQLQRRLEGKD